MKFTKMSITGQLDSDGAERLALRVGAAILLLAAAPFVLALGKLLHWIRWW